MAMASPISMNLSIQPISSVNKFPLPKRSNIHSYTPCSSPTTAPRNGVLKKYLAVKCKALSDGTQGNRVYQGVYGPWTVEQSDKLEVILYRGGLVTSALSFILASSSAFLPNDSYAGALIQQNLDLLYTVGSGGLGLSLLLIHIYVTPIKRSLQILWALGVAGSLATYLNLALPAGEGLVEYVMENPVAVWFVGPLFASLTGLVFKEGLCYGKLEAAGLTLVIPILLLGHLAGVMDNNIKLGLLGVWMALFVVFATRKFTQPIKDDIGDKSIFIFNGLSEEEKAAFLRKREEEIAQSVARD